MCKISVVIPVYNVESYLGECLDSLLNQTFKDFEVILVNDGSKDKSDEICDLYSKIDSRITVIHKLNGGASSARNVGIRLTKGKYIYFIDADDWINEKTLEELHSRIDEYNNAIVICGYNVIDDLKQKNDLQIIPEKFTTNDPKEIMHRFIHKKYSYSLWNKLYCADLIKKENIYFDENIIIGEDQSFNMRYISFCSYGTVIPKALYNYRIRYGALTSAFNEDLYNYYIKSEDIIIDTFIFNGKFNIFKGIIAAHSTIIFNEYFGGLASSGLSLFKKFQIHKNVIRYLKDKGFLKWQYKQYLSTKFKIIFFVFLFRSAGISVIFYELNKLYQLKRITK